MKAHIILLFCKEKRVQTWITYTPCRSYQLLEKVRVVVELDQAIRLLLLLLLCFLALAKVVSVQVLLDGALNFLNEGARVSLGPKNDHFKGPFTDRYELESQLDVFQELCHVRLIVILFTIDKGFCEDKKHFFVLIVVANTPQDFQLVKVILELQLLLDGRLLLLLMSLRTTIRLKPFKGTETLTSQTKLVQTFESTYSSTGPGRGMS